MKAYFSNGYKDHDYKNIVFVAESETEEMMLRNFMELAKEFGITAGGIHPGALNDRYRDLRKFNESTAWEITAGDYDGSKAKEEAKK